MQSLEFWRKNSNKLTRKDFVKIQFFATVCSTKPIPWFMIWLPNFFFHRFCTTTFWQKIVYMTTLDLYFMHVLTCTAKYIDLLFTIFCILIKYIKRGKLQKKSFLSSLISFRYCNSKPQ